MPEVGGEVEVVVVAAGDVAIRLSAICTPRNSNSSKSCWRSSVIFVRIAGSESPPNCPHKTDCRRSGQTSRGIFTNPSDVNLLEASSYQARGASDTYISFRRTRGSDGPSSSVPGTHWQAHPLAHVPMETPNPEPRNPKTQALEGTCKVTPNPVLNP